VNFSSKTPLFHLEFDSECPGLFFMKKSGNSEGQKKTKNIFLTGDMSGFILEL
jgi:hypothetical protein